MVFGRSTTLIGAALRSIVIVPKILIRCRRMHARWPWHAFDAYLDLPLARIRDEYGIEVVSAA